MPNKKTVEKAAERLIVKKALETLPKLPTEEMPTVPVVETTYKSKTYAKTWALNPQELEDSGLSTEQVKLMEDFARANKLTLRVIIDEKQRDKFLDAFIKSMGNASEAQRVTGIRTHYHYMWKLLYPEYQAGCESVTNTMLDIAESQLFKAIRSGNMTAIIFYLKCLGKPRGYVDRVMVDNGQLVTANQLNINVTDKETKGLMNEAIRMISDKEVHIKKAKQQDEEDPFDGSERIS